MYCNTKNYRIWRNDSLRSKEPRELESCVRSCVIHLTEVEMTSKEQNEGYLTVIVLVYPRL